MGSIGEHQLTRLYDDQMRGTWVQDQTPNLQAQIDDLRKQVDALVEKIKKDKAEMDERITKLEKPQPLLPAFIR